MLKKLILTSVSLLWLYTVTASPYSINITVGADLFATSQAGQTVVLVKTPDGQIVSANQYGTATPDAGMDLMGIAAGYKVYTPRVDSWLKNLDVIAGVGLYHYSTLFRGTETPNTNLGGGDPLNYSYEKSSVALLAQTTFLYHLASWDPYLLVGIGPGFTRASNYSESPVDPDGSATPIAPYQSHTSTKIAYELALGAQKKLDAHIGLSADLRYMSFGSTYLTAPSGQYFDPNAQLDTGHVNFFGLGINMIYQF